MKKRINHLSNTAVLFLILLAFSACHSSKDKGLQYIPKDVSIVFSLNFKQISEKLKDGNLNTDSLMNILTTQDSNFALLKDFDLRKPVFIFVKNSNSMMQGNDLFTGMVATLDNKSALESDLVKNNPTKSIQKGKTVSYMQLAEHVFMAWNDEIVTLLSSNKLEAAGLDDYFAMKKDASLADHKEAAKLLSADGDLNFYGNANGSLGNIPFLAMSKASDLLKDNYGGGTINFENGKVVMKAKNYYNSTLTDLIKKNPSENLSDEGLSNFPGNPLGFLSISFNVKQIVSFLEYAGIKNTAETYLNNLGLTLNDVQDAFKGEIDLAISGITSIDKKIPIGDTSIMTHTKMPKMLINIPLNNKEAYNKVAAALAKMGIFVNANGQLVPKMMEDPSSGAIYRVTDKAVVISTDAPLVDGFLAGKQKMTYPEDLDRKSKTAYGYGNLQSIFQTITASSAQPIDSALALAQQTFKDFAFSADNMKGNEASMEMTLHLMDNSKNSLSVLANFIQKENLIQKAKEASFTTTGVLSDSTMDTNIPAPPSMGQTDSGK